MENKNNVLLTVLGVCTLLVALVGASFAYFTATSTTTERNIQTGRLEILSTLSATEQKEIKPTTFSTTNADTNADVAKFTFNVKGTTDAGATNVTGATYNIKLLGTTANVKNVENQGSAADIEYALYEGTAATGTLVKTGSFTTVASATTITDEAKELTGATNDTYTLYVYIKETSKNQDNLQAVTIGATMTAEAQTPAPTPAA